MLSVEELIRRGEDEQYENEDLLRAFDWFAKALRRKSLAALKEIVEIGERINYSFWDPLIKKVSGLVEEGVLSEEDKGEIVNLTFVTTDNEDIEDALQKLLGEVVKYDLLDQCIEESRIAIEEAEGASDIKWMGI